MRRALVAICLLLVTASGSAAEKWWEAYNRGVKAVHAKQYDEAVSALQQSLAAMPNESGAARVGNQAIVYVPHFWLGVAKFNLGDTDGALREWKTSEAQGAVQSTQYYAQLRGWVGRAQSQNEQKVASTAADAKRDANTAVGQAVSAQMDAVGAGADRSDRYRAAQRRLQEAVDAVAGAGTDVLAYRRATDIAEDARKQFAAVAHDARQERTPRPAPVRPQPVAPRPVAPEPVAPEPVAPPAVQVPEPQSEPVPLPVTETVEAARPAPVEVVARPIAPVREESVRPQLEAAWRAFAAGDLGGSEEQLTRILAAHSSGEAYLLRGCTRYTRAMLSRKGDLDGAEADFRAALRVNRALRLDPAAFSPKLVTYFERLRTSPASKPLL